MYLGIPPFGQTVRTVTTITASASQTAFTPTGGYIVGYVDVYYNGVKLIDGDDYTATNGSTVTLTTAANAGDSVELVSYMPVSLADTYRQAEADSRFVNVTGDTMSGVHRHNTYLSIGKGPNNNDQITFNAVPDNSGNYTPVWTGNSSAGGSIIGMNSGGNGGLVIRSLRFGTNSSPQAESAYPVRWQITDDGMITMPYQPAFMAYNAEGQFVSGILAFNSTRVNRGSVYNTSNGRFTAPIAGTYLLSFDALCDNNSSVHGFIRINGTTYNGNEFYQDGTTNSCVSKQIIWSMAAGDYADVILDSPSRVHQRYGSFNGYLIG